MINFIIYLAFLFSLFYFLIRNRFDFLLVFFLSLSLYHWQIIFGKIVLPPYYFEVSNNSKLIISFVFLIHTSITFLHDVINKNKGITFETLNVTKKYNLIFYILSFVSFFLTVRALYIVGVDFIDKGDYAVALLDNNISMIWLHYPATMSLLYATLTKNRYLFILSLLPLLNYAYMGYRADFIVAIVGCLSIYSYNSKLFSHRILKVFLFTSILFVFFSIYKITYYYLKNPNVSVVEKFYETSQQENYQSPREYFINIFFYNEWGQVASNLSLSAENNLGKYYKFSTVIIGSIPFVKKFTNITEDDVRFSRLISEYANPGFSYGIGSTIWGEAYAAFNIFGVILFSIIISLIIAFLNQMFYRPSLIYLSSLMFLSFISFYVHRNDLTLLFAHLKNIIFLLIVSYPIFLLFKFIQQSIRNETKK